MRRVVLLLAATVAASCFSDSGSSGQGGSADTGTGSASGTEGSLPGCGNGMPDPDEVCDDGNDVNEDDCNNVCREHGALLWSAAPGPRANDIAWDVTVDDAGVYVTGVVADDDAMGGGNAFVARYDHDGAEQWTWRGSGPGSESDQGLAITVAQGKVFVAGYVTMATEASAAVWAIDAANGADVWGPTLTMPGAWARAIAALPDGEVLIAGAPLGAGTGFAARVSSIGQIQWEARQPPDAITSSVADAVAVGDQVVLCGDAQPTAMEPYSSRWAQRTTTDGLGTWTLASTILSEQNSASSCASDGTDLWLAVGTDSPSVERLHRVSVGTGQESTMFPVDSVPNVEEQILGVAVDAAGSVVVAGQLGTGLDSEIWLARYGADGTEHWSVTVTGPGGGLDSATGVAIADDGFIYVSGVVGTPDGTQQMWLGKFAP